MEQNTNSAYFNAEWRRKLATEMLARHYSGKTIKAYLRYNADICETLKLTPELVNTDDIKEYLANANEKRRYSSSTMNLALSAAKFFYANVCESPIARSAAAEIRRPFKERKLPEVFSRQEVSQIINAANNIKHRFLLTLAYSSGVRVSELVALRKSDIDTARKTVKIREGKGGKGRYTILSEKAIREFAAYTAQYQITDWLFPGQGKDAPLSTRSAQKIFEHALAKSGVKKPASMHTLRHSFATHLLEDGVNIAHIKALLGHTLITTTQRYTRIAQEDALAVTSPLDK